MNLELIIGTALSGTAGLIIAATGLVKVLRQPKPGADPRELDQEISWLRTVVVVLRRNLWRLTANWPGGTAMPDLDPEPPEPTKPEATP